MKKLRIILTTIAICNLATCATTSTQVLTNLENRAGKDIVKITNAQLDKAEAKIK